MQNPSSPVWAPCVNEDLIEHIAAKSGHLPEGHRYMVGIVGFPGAGKSTTAEALVHLTNQYFHQEVAAPVPMDGFHLANLRLDELDLRALKGIPETFDAEGFVQLLKSLRQTPSNRVTCPAFDRALDEPTPDAIVVESHHRILIVEGNYLLLQNEPWCQIRNILDEIWYLDVAIETIVPRLVERHIAGGRTPDAAREKMENTDLRNARLIEKTKQYATRVLSFER